MNRIKEFAMLIIAITLIGICSYEMHIMPRNGAGLNLSVIKVIEACEIISIISLSIVSIKGFRIKKFFPSRRGHMLKNIYIALGLFIFAIALFSNTSHPMQTSELNAYMFIVLGLPYMLAIVSMVAAIEFGAMTIIRLFPEKKDCKVEIEK